MKTGTSCAKELIILTEHLWPSTGATAQLVKDLADDLHAKGSSLRVLTATAPALAALLQVFLNDCSTAR